jgi:hypothetical protein
VTCLEQTRLRTETPSTEGTMQLFSANEATLRNRATGTER